MLLTWAKAFALSIVAVLAPIKAMVLAALVVTLLDSLLGVWAARKRGEAITSAGFRRTISKALVFMTALVVGHVCGVYLLGGLIPVASLVAGCIGVVEGKSCLENASAVLGQNVFRAVVDRIGSRNDTRPGA